MKPQNAMASILADYVLESSEDEEPILKKPCKIWVKDWVMQRQQEGCFANLLAQLRSNESELYRNFLRMDSDQFDHLLNLVTSYIQKKETNMRKSISAGERLVLTLRYLATSESFRSLQYILRIPASTISYIIPEVLDAVYKVLVNMYIQTPKTDIADKFNELWQFPNCIGRKTCRDGCTSECWEYFN